jgi:hypothetical protein
VEQEQPHDEEEGPPRPAGEEAPSRGQQRHPDQHAPARPLEPLAEVEILHDRERAIAPERAEDVGAHEDALVTVVVAGEPVADAVDPSDGPQAPDGLREQVLERPADDPRIGQHPPDQLERLKRRRRVRMDEEEDVA